MPNNRCPVLALSACLGLAAVTFAGSAAHAQITYNFTGASYNNSVSYTNNISGNWDSVTNWTPNGIPGVADSATLFQKNVVKIGGTINVATLTLNQTSLYVSTDSALSAQLTSIGTYGNEIELDNAAPGGTRLTIASGATLSGELLLGVAYGSGSNPTSVINNGTITNNLSGIETAIHCTFDNNGTVQATSGANLSFGTGSDVLTNSGSGTIGITGGGTLSFSYSGTHSLTNNGTVNVTGSTLQVINSNVLTGSGTYNLNSTILDDNIYHSITFDGTARYFLDGTTTVASSPMTVTMTGGATLGGSGTLASTISVSNTGGTVSPGHSPGVLTIGGSYTQGAGGNLLIEIGGTNAGTDYDVLSVGGAASLGGTLTLSFINGFQPMTGQAFNFFNSGSETGSFSNIVYQNAPVGDTFSVSKNGNSFILNTIAGVVSAAAPEPGSLAFLLPVLAPLGMVAARRRIAGRLLTAS